VRSSPCLPALPRARVEEATHWAGRDVVIDGVDDVSGDQLYRATAFRLDCAERVQESAFFSVAFLLNLEVDVIFFDTTSTYFESDPEDDGAGEDLGESGSDDSDAQANSGDEEQTGTSGEATADDETVRRRRQRRSQGPPPRPQIVIGLAVTREGIPVRCRSHVLICFLAVVHPRR
jgi:hypothetical protein